MKIRLPRIDDVLHFVFAVLLLLSCFSVYYMVYSKIIDYSCLAVTGILAVYKISKPGSLKRLRRKSTIKLVLLYFLMVLIVTICMQNTGASYVIRYLYFYPLSIIVIASRPYDENMRLLSMISKIIYFLAISSTLVWILGPLLNIVSPIGSYDVFWGYQSKYSNYFGVLFTTSIQSKFFFDQRILRNLCIYPEGPFTSLVFTIGFATEMFLDSSKMNLKRLIVYVVAIVSTISTTGMLMIFLILALKYMQSQVGKGSIRNGSYIFRTFIIPIVLIIVGYIAAMYVLELKQVNDIGNYLAHLQDLQNGFADFLKKPLTGYGYAYTALSAYGNNTSGLFKILIYGGILFGAFFLFPYIRAIIYGFSNKNSGLSIFAIIIFILLLTVIWQNSFLCLFYMSVFFVLTMDKENRLPRNTQIKQAKVYRRKQKTNVKSRTDHISCSI